MSSGDEVSVAFPPKCDSDHFDMSRANYCLPRPALSSLGSDQVEDDLKCAWPQSARYRDACLLRVQAAEAGGPVTPEGRGFESRRRAPASSAPSLASSAGTRSGAERA
jgi:hypothetical protein